MRHGRLVCGLHACLGTKAATAYVLLTCTCHGYADVHVWWSRVRGVANDLFANYSHYETQECPERGALRARRVHWDIAAARVQLARVDGRGAEGPEALRGRRALDSARTPTLACSPQRKHVTGTTESLGPDPGG